MSAMPAGPVDATMTVFVYFRASPEAVDRTEAVLCRHLTLVRDRLGLHGRFGLRRDQDKPYVTWLEVYDGVHAADLERTLTALDRVSTDSGLAEHALEGRRHETFAMRAPG